MIIDFPTRPRASAAVVPFVVSTEPLSIRDDAARAFYAGLRERLGVPNLSFAELDRFASMLAAGVPLDLVREAALRPNPSEPPPAA